MATGILSMASAEQGQALIARLLLALALLAFLGLTVACATDSHGHGTALDRFTMVAACGVLADLPDLAASPLAHLLRAAAIVAWVLACLRVPRRADRFRGIRGSWLLAAVASQSLSISVSAWAGESHSGALFWIAGAFWLLGLGLYAVLITVILARLGSGRVGLANLSPDYWISMGALAISTVAGVRLVESAAAAGQPPAVSALLAAAALLTWVLATSWLPYLVAVEAARDIRIRSSLRFEPARWSMVFPLGMYAVATQLLGSTLGFTPAGVIAKVSWWAGLAVWVFAVSTLTTARQVRRHD